MSGGDLLSVLPDDLLLRVLHFTPAREGASTGALSKRWRGLWRSSGAVNLDARIPKDADYLDDFYPQRDAIVSAARLSLEAAAAGSPVTRLTFRVTGDSHGRVGKFLYYDMGYRSRSPDVVTEFLSLPAARRVEELQLAAGYPSGLIPFMDQEVGCSVVGTMLNPVCFLSLPSETLRVLNVTGWSGLELFPGVTFPRLASLRLSLCSVCIENLQEFIHAAPALATVHMESVIFQEKSAPKGLPPQREGLIVRLHCPAATTLVLDRCCWLKETQGRGGTTAVEIDAPRLRRFRYRGLLRQFALSSQAPDLARVDLHIIHNKHRRDKDPRRDLVTFWRFLQNFSNAKELKLRVNMLEDMAVVSPSSRAKLLCSFGNLERLQLEGMHRLKGKTAAATIANLLSCCPVLCDLRINLAMAPQPDYLDRGPQLARRYLERKYRHDLEKSVHGFMNRNLETIEVDCDDGDASYDNLSDLPALSAHVFHCLLSTLSCVRLQFRTETYIFGPDQLRSNFASKLIKFFAENAVVLKEMYIDGGNGKMCEHMNCKLERWAANLSEKRKATFVVLPLES